MSDQGLKRRTYGFRHENKQRQVITHGERTNPRPTSQDALKMGLWWFLYLPFRILKWFFWFLRWLWQKSPRLSRETKKNIKSKLGWVILIGFVSCFLAGTVTIAWVSRDLPDPDRLTDRQVAQSTKIYDRTGQHLLYEVFADQKRTLVDLEQVPKYLVNGLIATEDKEFYNHRGIRPLGWVRAVVYGIFTSKQIGGTSTLTQQLVRNAILSTERSYLRKIKEVILSIRLEQKYTKDQILKIYFNEIPYGSTNYGVESASLAYFGKNVSELDLQESATLAGMPKAPSRYLNDKEALKNRRDFVLERMFQEGYITREEANTAQAQPVTLEKSYGEIKAPHFVLYVRQQLVEKYGEKMVDTGGLRVLTTLDWDKQQIAEMVIKEESEKRFVEANADNASLVALDPKTGQVLAMVGSRDFYDEKIDGQFNVAVQARRQPGSSFKPIIYTAAFEKGYTPETILWDVHTNFAVSGKPYEPRNYDLGERGPVTMRQALQGSLNIPAVETLYLVGAEKGVEFAERLGYTTLSTGNFGLSLVLGGGEVKLIEHTAAYGVFANNGIKQDVSSILKIEAPDGEVLYEWKAKKGEKVLDEKITATISNVLADDVARAYVFGTGGVLTLPGRSVASKTGTTNSYIDAWTVGYTPSLVAGVWVGRTDNKPMNKGDGGSRLAAPIWQRFMKEVLVNAPVENFPEPPENDAQKPILRGSVGGGVTLAVNKFNNRLATSSTPEGAIEKRTYVPAHSILHYVYKDDPRGPVPEHPEADPQYEVWETAIQDWVRRQKEKNPDWQINFEEPPTEYDTMDSVGLMPTLTVHNLYEGEVLSSRHFNIQVTASAPRGITKVSYKLNERHVGVVRSLPFTLNYYWPDLVNGEHILIVTAEDDIGNRAEQIIKFILDAPTEQPVIYWSADSLNLKASGFPQTLFLDHYRLVEIVNLKIYQEKNNDKILLLEKNNFTDLFNNQVLFKWENNPGENVVLISEITLKNGEVRESGRLPVLIN